MARYGEAFRNRVVARLLPPESAKVGEVAKEIGVTVQTLERWREDAQSRLGLGRSFSAGARLEAVITVAAMDEAGKNAWCRDSVLRAFRRRGIRYPAIASQLTGVARRPA